MVGTISEEASKCSLACVEKSGEAEGKSMARRGNWSTRRAEGERGGEEKEGEERDGGCAPRVGTSTRQRLIVNARQLQ